jgi:hypothetical protein
MVSHKYDGVIPAAKWATAKISSKSTFDIFNFHFQSFRGYFLQKHVIRLKIKIKLLWCLWEI